MNMANHSSAQRINQRRIMGMSLVELLIAMTLGLILISGMIAVFAGNKRSSDLNTAMADIQENARFALESLSSDIRMSGFQGCVDINRGKPQIIGTNIPTTDLYATATMGSVIGDSQLWSPSPPIGFVPANHDAIAGSHALSVQFGSPATYPLVQPVGVGGIPDRAAPIIINTTPGISRDEFNMSAGDFAIISNCVGADVIRVSSVTEASNSATIGHTAPYNDSGALNFDFTNDASTKFMRFVSRVYYVGDTGLKNDNGDDITALYQQSLPYGNPALNPPTELIRGVENMRIAFGIRTGAQSLTYVEPDDPKYDPRLVESVRIGLLLNSYDRISQSDDINTYVLAGQPIVAKDSGATNASGEHEKDKRYRLAFNTTIKIRNRRN